MKFNNKGVSWIELVVVIAIMAVLTSVLAPALLTYVYRSRAEKAMNDFCDKNEFTIVSNEIYEDITPSTIEAFDCVVADISEKLHTITFELTKEGYVANDIALFDSSNNQEDVSDDLTIIQIPEGYEFVMWADDEKTSYIVEDGNGNQIIIIIGDDEKVEE